MEKVKISVQKLDQLVHDFKKVRHVIHDQYENLGKIMDMIDKELVELTAEMEVKKEKS